MTHQEHQERQERQERREHREHEQFKSDFIDKRENTKTSPFSIKNLDFYSFSLNSSQQI